MTGDGSPVPLVDLHAQQHEVADEVRAGFDEVLAEAGFVGGPAVERFEREYASFTGVRHCVGVANGTDALELALRAVGVERGDDVLVPANTFVATAEAVCRLGARPVPVDVDDEFLLIDPAQVRDRATARTRAVVPVHLFGQAAPVESLVTWARAVGARVVEDAAQSQGAQRRGAAAGALGDVAATSFYPGKNLGAYGDAGAVLTDHDDVARQVRLLGNHGSEVRYEHQVVGFNSRLDTLQAVVLSAKLRRLAAWNAARRRAAARYDEMLAGLDGVRTPRTAPGNVHVWHLYVVRVERRDEVLRRLGARGIGAGVHYPVPVHLHEAFRDLDCPRGSMPVAEAAAHRILSLPLFPHITESQQERVVSALREAL